MTNFRTFDTPAGVSRPTSRPLALALGAALSGHALVASANGTTTVIGSTTSNYTMYGAQDLLFRNAGTINTSLSPALTVDSSVTNSTITLQAGSKLASTTGTALLNNGQVSLLANSSLISGAVTAIDNRSSITEIQNAGTITGVNAIVNTGTIGSISNSGTISGNIDLGASTLTISGGSGSSFGTLTGGTIVSSATGLTLGNGNHLLDDDVVLASGAGTLVSSGGMLQINRPLTLSGSYVQNASETLVIGVSDSATANGTTADTGYGRLTVSGSATIAAGSSVELRTTGSSYAFAPGQRYVVMTATSAGTQYNASSLNYSAAGYADGVTGASIVDGANSNLVLTLASGGSSLPVNAATNGNSTQALGGLFSYGGTQPQLLNLFNAAAAIGPDSAEANTVGAKLSPVSMASANFRVSTASSGAASGVVHTRLGLMRRGLSSGDGALDKAVWMQVFGSHVKQGERDGLSGYDASFNGLMIGADRPLADRWRVGAALSYISGALSESDANRGNSLDSHAVGVHGYAGYDAETWYLNLDASFSKVRYDSTRRVDFTGFSGTARGHFDGEQYSASAEAGRPIDLGERWVDTTLTPIASLSWSRLEQSGYTESGGNGAALDVGSVGGNSLSSVLGGRFQHRHPTRWGALASYVQLGWRHEYLNTRVQTTSSFVADASGATSFVNQGAKPLRDTATVALGATLTRSEQMLVSGRLQFDGGDSYRAYGANITVRYRF